MPSLNQYLIALKEVVGEEQFSLASLHLTVARKILDEKKRLTLTETGDRASRRALLDKWFGNYLVDAVKNVIILMAEQYSLDLLDENSVEKNEQKTVAITSARQLATEKKQWIAGELKKILGDALIQWKEDRGLIGGIKIRVNDKEIDASIRSRLNALTKF